MREAWVVLEGQPSQGEEAQPPWVVVAEQLWGVVAEQQRLAEEGRLRLVAAESLKGEEVAERRHSAVVEEPPSMEALEAQVQQQLEPFCS